MSFDFVLVDHSMRMREVAISPLIKLMMLSRACLSFRIFRRNARAGSVWWNFGKPFPPQRSMADESEVFPRSSDEACSGGTMLDAEESPSFDSES